MTPFVKMHGLGNDFVVLDLRGGLAAPGADAARLIADRRRGIGCDQLILIEPPEMAGADVRLRFLNSDGSESGACGNGTRCVASRLMGESGADRLVIQTLAGRLEAALAPGGLFTVDMGAAHLDWRDIPLAEECDTLHLPIASGPLEDPAAWVENLPYYETRDYIPRVLAFTTLYDWRLQRPVRRLSSRMPAFDSGAVGGTMKAAETTEVVCRVSG